MLKRILVLKYFLILSILLALLDFCGILKHIFEIDYSGFIYPLHGSILKYAQKLQNNRSLDVQPINNYNYYFIYPSASICHDTNSVGSPHLILLVKSAIKNFERRDVIRKTWGSSAVYPNVRTVFLLGCSSDEALEHVVNGESDYFNDIVKANFMDSYYNNTIKLLMGLQWIVNHCSQASHFMFVDDDYFVSTQNALLYIRNPSIYGTNDSGDENKFKFNINSTVLENQIMFAGFQFHSSPQRHKFSKWYVSLAEYPYDRWPPYITAGAYILSREAAFKLYYTSLFVKQFRFDDIYLGIVALKAEIKATHSDYFYFQKATYSNPVDYQYIIASHGYGNPKELMRVWLECHNAGFA